ncbi:MAG: hypothetical protein COA79_21030 [Planctomycetota bacterium]|nr:MAG: hypothetical protein COA79_21030 [Planctomycetota bacterium]
MEELLVIVKEVGLGVTMMVYILYMFNRQNKQRESDFTKQIQRWEKHELKYESKIDKLDILNEQKDKYIRDTLASLVRETHEYFKLLNNSFEKLTDKVK